MLGPQAWAFRQGFRVGGHLALLLASIVGLSGVWIWLAIPASDNEAVLTLRWLAIGGLAMLVPMFLALQQMFPTYDYRLATVFAQAFALVLTAALMPIADASASNVTALFEGCALLLVLALFCVALHVVHRGELK